MLVANRLRGTIVCREVPARPLKTRYVDLLLGVLEGVSRGAKGVAPPLALKELEVKYASKRDRDYKLSDGGGLYVLVRPNGSKLWRVEYRFDGREKMLSFGSYPAVSLAGWNSIAEDEREMMFAQLRETLPIRRIGAPIDLAEAALAVMTNRYISGSVLHCDGGVRLA